MKKQQNFRYRQRIIAKSGFASQRSYISQLCSSFIVEILFISVFLLIANENNVESDHHHQDNDQVAVINEPENMVVAGEDDTEAGEEHYF